MGVFVGLRGSLRRGEADNRAAIVMPRKVRQTVTHPGTGQRLRAARIALGYDYHGGLKAYADQAGLAPNAYSQNENGIKRIEVDAAISLCKTYGLTLDYIYLGDRSGLRSELRISIAPTPLTT